MSDDEKQIRQRVRVDVTVNTEYVDYLHKASGTYALCGGKLEATKVWWTRKLQIRPRSILRVGEKYEPEIG